LRFYQNQQDNFLEETFSEAKSPKQAIISLFKGISDDIRSGNHKGCMITGCTSEMSHEPAVKDFLISNKDKVVDSFAALIRKAQDQGEISRMKDAETLALYLFSNLQGLRLTSMIEPNLEAGPAEILSII